MKKLFGVLLLVAMCMTLAGCKKQSYKLESFKIANSESIQKLGNVTYPDSSNEKKNYVTSDFQSILYDFTTSTTSEIFSSNVNYVYSPMSLYMAMAMLLEGCDGDSYTEVAELLNVTSISDLRNNLSTTYHNNYYTNDNGVMRMANSIWVAKRITLNESYYEALAKYYYAESYNVDFASKSSKQAIVDWINHYTFDFLELTIDNYSIDDGLAVLLLNTLYFNNKWKEEYKEKNNYHDTFYGLTEELNTEYMTHTVASEYYENDYYTAVYDYFYNNNTIKYILPKDNVTTSKILQDKKILEEAISYGDYTKWVYVSAMLSVPKFSYKTTLELNDKLKALGVNEIFTSAANLSKMSSVNDLYVSYVKQDVRIELNEEGAKAAAVTSIGVKDSSAAPGDLIEFKLNRPFIYIIYDANSLPLFIGVVNNPNA